MSQYYSERVCLRRVCRQGIPTRGVVAQLWTSVEPIVEVGNVMNVTTKPSGKFLMNTTTVIL